jgi:SAM-dependent methyltransferase
MAVQKEIYDAQTRLEERNMRLKKVEPEIVRKAWFTLSHLLLDEGSKVVDMGCGDGAMTYAMAALNPKLKFIGIEKNKRDINKAKEQFELHNLEFISADAATTMFEPESLDAIINSFVLHEIYSGSRYNPMIVRDTLETQLAMLKKGGMLLIRDYLRPPPEEYVLMEMPDTPSKGGELAKLSEADLLVWYSEHARPRQDPGCGGFFLEELPPRFPRTRLFRLPHKWAYEFILRKDDRAHWEKELSMEYTYYTERDFRKTLNNLGARVHYAGPHWDEDYIEEKFEGRFRLFHDSGTPLGYPATSYIAVAVKMAERKSLMIAERRPSGTESSKLKITAMRDGETGQIIDIVSRNMELSEIIPYRVDEEGQLKVYLHDGIARSIVGAVPRNGVNIDGRRWSGHMIEAISVDGEGMATMEEFDVKHTVRFARDYLGLKPKDNAILQIGPYYYPAPDYIDERINTYYLSVEHAKGNITPRNSINQAGKFQARGQIREMDAQQVLNAITVGMIPNSRLELQILMLFNFVGKKPESWTSRRVAFQAGKVTQKTKLRDLMNTLKLHQSRFKDVKGTAGQLRPVHSIFVEEGQSKGAVAGLAADDVDFIVHDDQTVNTAVVLPLAFEMKKEVHAGFLMKHLPVPQRHEGISATIAAPSFDIPREITNLKLMKKFIAEQYGVLPNMVIKLGESYFTHIGLTPHRIHPFAVTIPPNVPKKPGTEFLPFYQFRLLRRSLGRDPHFMLLISRAYLYLHEEIKLDYSRNVSSIVKERFDKLQPEWTLPMNYELAPIPRKKAAADIDMADIADLEKEKADQKI